MSAPISTQHSAHCFHFRFSVGTHWVERILHFLTSEEDLEKVHHHTSIPIEVIVPGEF